MNEALVSILMPVLNGADFIKRSVDSVLSQTYTNIELLVLDGGSTDRTHEVLRKIEDSRLRVLFDCGSVADAFNMGVETARGSMIGFCCADDCYVPDAVQSAVEWLDCHPDDCAVTGDTMYVEPDGSPKHQGMISWRGIVTPSNICWVTALRHRVSSLFVIGSTFWRQGHVPRFRSEFGYHVDCDLFARMVLAGDRIGNLKRILSNYTVHPTSLSVSRRAEIDQQRWHYFDSIEMKWYHCIVWRMVGPFSYWLLNPYGKYKYRLKQFAGVRSVCLFPRFLLGAFCGKKNGRPGLS